MEASEKTGIVCRSVSEFKNLYPLASVNSCVFCRNCHKLNWVYMISLRSFFLLTALSLCTCFVMAQARDTTLAIIPEPVSVQRMEGNFTLPKEVTIGTNNKNQMDAAIALLQDKLTTAAGRQVSIGSNGEKATISLQLNAQANAAIEKEGYVLTVNASGAQIAANDAAGIFYGVQTLLQLLPPQIEGDEVADIEWQIPYVEIKDYPRFAWRGLMLDVSRHFFTVEEVKKFIDDMARYKYNVMHWHLTDDEGWRIEIKAYPKLTSVGAWRVDKTGYFGTFSKPLPDEPKSYGGFYTQEEVKDIVRYAQERFVDILPEIDVPGHSLATVVSYPELSCTEGVEKYNVRAGEEIMDWSRGAPPIALVDNTLCPANEKVYEFLDKVIGEVAALFPFEYIHMGGDEAPHNFWEKNPQVQALMKREGLKTIPEVQGYFTRRVQKIVDSKGKKFIGWDEILEGGLPKEAAVMAWRSMEEGVRAAKNGHEVVMTPTSHAYLDYMQGDPVIEPRIYASLRLRKTYEFDPLPAGVNKDLILGAQGNIWTEQIYNTRHLEYMTWPRAWAIAEAAWTPIKNRDFSDFFRRVENHFERFDVAGTKYAPSVYDPIFAVSRQKDGQLLIDLSTEIEGLDIHYSFDNSFPDHHYPKYVKPLNPPKDAVMLKVITYRGDERVGRMISMPIEELNKRAGKR